MSIEEHEKIDELRGIAAQFRDAANKTALPEFAEMLSRAAVELEQTITEIQGRLSAVGGGAT